MGFTLALLWSVGVAHAGPPCGGITLDGKRVITKTKLAPSQTVSSADKACATAIGAALAKRGRVRSVTIVVRVPNAARLDGSGKRVAKAWASALASGGVPAARVSTLVPPVRAGGKPQITLTYRAAPSRRPVALIQAVTGTVRGGRMANLKELRAGSKLVNGDLVITAAASVTRIALADGSFVTLAQKSRMKIGRIELTRDLKRRVRLDLVSGKIECRAWYKKPGESFRVHSKTGIAGVRGTHFRVTIIEPPGTMVVETLEGVVELSNARPKGGKPSVIRVPAGFASQIIPSGKPAPLQKLLPQTEIKSPLKGTVTRGVVLKWDAVDGAVQYRVDVATDAEFATGVRSFLSKIHRLKSDASWATGRFFWRVSAIDKRGLVGMSSKVYSVVLKAPKAETSK